MSALTRKLAALTEYLEAMRSELRRMLEDGERPGEVWMREMAGDITRLVGPEECPQCHGAGQVEHEVWPDEESLSPGMARLYVRRGPALSTRTCERCGGTGVLDG